MLFGRPRHVAFATSERRRVHLPDGELETAPSRRGRLRPDLFRSRSRAHTAPVVRFSAAAIEKTERPASCRSRSLRSSSSVQALLWFVAITKSVKERVSQNAVSTVVVPTSFGASRSS
jgi:hypothetical protein